MNLHPKFEFLEKVSSSGFFRLDTINLWMGMYGSATPKPTLRWASSSWAQVLILKEWCVAMLSCKLFSVQTRLSFE